MSEREFVGARLRLARTFAGLTLAELGEQLAVSRQFVHQLEGSLRQPNDETIEALEATLGFSSHFFYHPVRASDDEEKYHFRARRTTQVSLKARVIAHGILFAELLEAMERRLKLPKLDVLDFTASRQAAGDIERAAEKMRLHWGLTSDAPIKSMVRTLERAGIVITTFLGLSQKVDAFSWHAARPIIVRTTQKTPSRGRFDLAHELGHLVIHQSIVTGSPEMEAEADRFASAFLLPRSGFVREFPLSSRWNWEQLFKLKERWGVSVAAIVRRAYDLNLVDAAQYRRGFIHIRSSGWYADEPHEPAAHEASELIEIALRQLSAAGLGSEFLAAELGWSTSLLHEISGAVRPDSTASNVVPLNR